MNLYDVHGNVISSSGGGLGDGFGVTDVIETGELNLFTDFEYTDGIWMNTGVTPPTQGIHASYTLSEKIYEVAEKEINVHFVKAAQFRIICYDANDNYLGVVSAKDGEYGVAWETVVIRPIDGTAYVLINPILNSKNNGDVIPTISGVTIEYCDFVDGSKRKMIPLQKRTEHENRMATLNALLWNYTKWNGKYIVADGNSLVESTNWLDDMCEFLGANAVNVGLSGSAITRPDQPSSTATIEEKRQYIKEKTEKEKEKREKDGYKKHNRP